MKTIMQVFSCTRANASNMGNPNWVLTGREFDEHYNGPYRSKARKTNSNLSISYGLIPNEIASKMPEPVEVELTLTRAGRISDIRVLGE